MSSFLNMRRDSHKSLCALLAALMFLGQATPLAAQQAQQSNSSSTPLRLSHALPDACLVIAARPRQVLTSAAMELLPTEVIQAAGIQEIGIDPLQAEQFVASVSPPLQGPPDYAVYVGFAQPVGLPKGQIVEHTASDTLNGKPYLQSQEPMLPSFYNGDGKSLIIAPESALQRVVGSNEAQGLADRIAAASTDDDLFVMIDVAALQPLIQMGLTQVEEDIPSELRSVLEIPGLIKTIQLRLNISHAGVSELVVQTAGAGAANRLTVIFDDVKGLMLAQMSQSEEFQQMLQSDDPVERAMGRYQQRISGVWNERIQLQTEGDEVILFRTDGAEDDPMVNVAVIGVLVALLLPAVQAAREAARRNSSMNNMKQLALALHNFHDVHGAFPAHASYDDQGKPLLSWRVHILPMLEQQSLYDQFHLDEPWDSPHNKTLIPQMPLVYLDPSSRFSPSDGRTHYLGAEGPGLFLDGTSKGIQMAQVRDGTTNSVSVMQVNDERAAVWTAPDDWRFDASAPLSGLVPTLHPGGFMAAFLDGHVQFFDQSVDPATLRAMLTVAGRDNP